jgi:hypothetical protein
MLGGKMMKFALIVSGLLFSMGVSWADVSGTTNAALFPDTVNWCQLGCAFGPLATPQQWTSADGGTGSVGLRNGQGIYNLQAGSTWDGGFSNGMGLLYNGPADGNSASDIYATFNQAEYGAGAYIHSLTGPSFTATITLYGASNQVIGSFTTSAPDLFDAGTAPFIGATSNTPVWAVQFDAVGGGANEPDFAIGTMGLATSPVPEPSFHLLLPALGLLTGLVLRRRTA